jgi:hypothetical protein
VSSSFLGLDGPVLALAEGGQRVEQLALGRFDDRAHLAGGVLRVAHLQEVTASISWLWNRLDLATEPTRITSEAAEHFCPAWPKAE